MPPLDDDEITTLQTPFEVIGGRLSIRYRTTRSGQMLGSLERLCLVTNKQATCKQLNGRVRITTPQAAYSFLSLPTSPRTLLIVDLDRRIRKINIVPASQLNLEYLYGDKGLFAGLRRGRADIKPRELRNGPQGIVDDNIFDSLGIPRTTQKQSGNGFVVGRHIFMTDIQNHSTRKICYLTQWVSTAGEVRTLEWKRLPDKMLGNVTWHIFTPS